MMKRLFAAGMIFTLACTASPLRAYVPDDTELSEQWYLDVVDAYDAWEVTTGSRDVVVAVLDTGIDLNHEDLVDNLWENPGEVEGDGIDNDDNGFIDDVHGWDFVEDDNTPAPSPDEPFIEDGVIHGTAIAGVIGAVGDNNQGIAGLTWDVQLMSLRILDNFGSGTSFDARRAIEYAVENGADVINLSFTGFELDTSFRDAVQEAFDANVTVVAAVGNQDDGGVDLDVTPIYPACFFDDDGTDWVVGVAASTEDDTKADFSNYGANCTDLSAPGEGIFSTSLEDESWASFAELYDGPWSGTSIASPMVTGAVALLKAAYPSLTPTQILTTLQFSVDPMQEQGTPAVGKTGAGRLNIARALEMAPLFMESEPEPTDEELEIVRDADGHRVAPASRQIGISPITGEPESVSEVQAGWFIRSEGFDTVYLVDEEFNRHPFWNGQTYFTWAESWDEVVWVTDATLSTLPLSTPLAPKAGVVLVKIQSVADVYQVEEGPSEWEPVLRRIASEEVAEEMYGATWADFVLDVEPTLFTRYTQGADVLLAESVDLTILKSRAEIAALLAGATE